MRKEINYNGRKLEVIATKISFPCCYYEYTVNELLEKKHWWNFGKRQILSGSTFAWSDDDDFETILMKKLEIVFKDNHTDNVQKFFQKNS